MSIDTLDAFLEANIKEYVGRLFDQPVERLRVRKLVGDASTRQYFRVTLPDGRRVVLAHYPDPIDPATHPTCEVTRLLERAGLPVPRIIDIEQKRGFMLVEDLGDRRLQDWVPRASPEERRRVYGQAIDLILRIQAATPLARRLGCRAARLAFDEEKLLWELSFFYENFFERLLARPLDERTRSKLFDEFTALARELAARPRVLCHRDYHSRNLMLHEGRLYIIDHQDARMGPTSYDVASLLGDPYVDLDEDFRREMLDSFIARRRALEPESTDPAWRSQFEHEYQLMLIQRLLKAVGTYAHQSAVVGNPVYDQYIPRALQTALAAVRAAHRFPVIRSTLEKLQP
ncbi:MAG: hypothetical protein D6723_18440 [Acidobacteria bacterium]|nr:MAG: hypothetical protein D6723_18440 [Acidobacteriota bacterium]